MKGNELLKSEFQAALPELKSIEERCKTTNEVLAAIFPEATEKQRDWFLWEKTGYPAWFSCSPGQTPAGKLIEQLWMAKMLSQRGLCECDGCSEILEGVEGHCQGCQ